MRADDTRRILRREEPKRLDGSPDPLLTATERLNVRKPMLLIGALICLALLTAIGAERWTLWQEQQAVAQTHAENQRLQRDTEQAQQAAAQAQTPDAIERAARNMGFIFPGDTPVIITQPQP